MFVNGLCVTMFQADYWLNRCLHTLNCLPYTNVWKDAMDLTLYPYGHVSEYEWYPHTTIVLY